MNWFEMAADNLGIVLNVFIAVITALAIIRIIVKMKKGKSVNITPVGVFNDLPESVTGIRKDKDCKRAEGDDPDEK